MSPLSLLYHTARVIVSLLRLLLLLLLMDTACVVHSYLEILNWREAQHSHKQVDPSLKSYWVLC